MSASDDIISAEVVEDWAEAKNRRSALEFFQSTTAMAIVLVVLFISSSLLYFMLDDDPVDRS